MMHIGNIADVSYYIHSTNHYLRWNYKQRGIIKRYS